MMIDDVLWVSRRHKGLSRFCKQLDDNDLKDSHGFADVIRLINSLCKSDFACG
jgi:hypothetical protein